MAEIVDGSVIYEPLFTDDDGYTWHILERAGGSMSLYATREGVGVHYVVYDTLDNKPPSEQARKILARLGESANAIRAILYHAGM